MATTDKYLDYDGVSYLVGKVNDKINAAVAGVFTYKGTKASEADLPTTGNNIGDVWFIGSREHAWNGTKWEILGINTNGYLTADDIKNKLDKGGYTGTANDLKSGIDSKLPKGSYTGNAADLDARISQNNSNISEIVLSNTTRDQRIKITSDNLGTKDDTDSDDTAFGRITKVDGKAEAANSAISILNGTGNGSISKKITDSLYATNIPISITDSTKVSAKLSAIEGKLYGSELPIDKTSGAKKISAVIGAFGDTKSDASTSSIHARINYVKDSASSAASAASTAQGTANTAVSNASAAQSTANSAKSTAEAALPKASKITNAEIDTIISAVGWK